FRDKQGFYNNFVSDTISAFRDSGMELYNEMVMVIAGGSIATRAGRFFNISRKISKQHQNVLVFYKGDPKKIGENFPELDLSYMQEEESTELGACSDCGRAFSTEELIVFEGLCPDCAGKNND